MLIGVMSDSHDNLNEIRRALRLFQEKGVEHLIHAGDFVAPFALKAVLASGFPVTAVLGNNDGEREGLSRICPTLHPAPHAFELAGCRILLAHDINQCPAEERSQADVVIVGHTHKPETRYEGKTLILNPGETGGWLNSRPTVALLDTATRGVSIVSLAP